MVVSTEIAAGLGALLQKCERLASDALFSLFVACCATARGHHGEGMLLLLTAQSGVIGGLKFG
jgi:hypothetical protein